MGLWKGKDFPKVGEKAAKRNDNQRQRRGFDCSRRVFPRSDASVHNRYVALFFVKVGLESFLLTHILLPLESMMTVRRATIKNLLEVTYDYFDLFFRDGVSVCSQSNASKACDALMCGSLVIGLRELGLWPQKSFDAIGLSIQDLASKLDSLVIWTYPANSFANHYNCGSAGFSDRIAAALRSIPDPVLEIHREHMRSQGLSRGLAIVPPARDHKDMGHVREL